MKALTVRQPWASLLVLREKRIETRTWVPGVRLRPRDWVAIHAGAGKVERLSSAMANQWAAKSFHKHGRVDLARGAIVGVARYLECRGTDWITRPLDVRPASSHWPNPISSREELFGDWGPNRFGWLFADAYPLDQPLPCRGQLGLWNLPEDLRRSMLRQLMDRGVVLLP